MKQVEELKATYAECVRRCTKEEVQAFLDRARTYWMNNPEMLAIVDSLEMEGAA